MELNKYIDHTLLKADATEKQIKKLCDEAKKYNFMSVCVNTCYVSLCEKMLKGTDVKVCAVVGFPLGAMETSAKAYEAKKAVYDGAKEIDMVINVGKLKSVDFDYVKNDIKAVVDVCKGKAIVKVIIETCLLTDDEKVKVCLMAKEVGADFVKTSTGFSTAGATTCDIELMRKTVGDLMGVKAAGGIRTKDEALKMIEAGATRIGTSNGILIVEGK